MDPSKLLVEAMLSEWKIPKSIEYRQAEIEQAKLGKRLITISLEALNIAIIEKMNGIVKFCIEWSKSFVAPNTQSILILNNRVTKLEVTPLHVAVIAQNLDAVKLLLDVRVDVTRVDYKGWLPLHHVAAHSDSLLAEQLEAFAAVDAKTKCGATYSDLLKLVDTSLPKAQDRVPLFWKDEKGEKQLTVGEFQEKTAGIYLKENRCTPADLWTYWSTTTPQSELYAFCKEIAQKYDSFDNKKVAHLLAPVTHDADGKKLASSPGLGLFARQQFRPGDILGEFTGVVELNSGSASPDKPNLARGTYYEYSLKGRNCELYRNEIAYVNDGFVNVGLVNIHNKKGLKVRNIMIALEPINPGQQLCWNYGFHPAKLRAYSEFRPQAFRTFVKKCVEEFPQFLKICKRAFSSPAPSNQYSLPIEEFALAEKFRYILSTPSALFSLVFDETINEEQAKFLCTLAITLETHHLAKRQIYLDAVPRAIASLRLKKKLKDNFSQMAVCYETYVQGLIPRVGIVNTLKLVEKINSNLSKAMIVGVMSLPEGLVSPSQMKKIAHGLVSGWKKSALPVYENSISKFHEAQEEKGAKK